MFYCRICTLFTYCILMATETLGAHLRNLLSPYKSLISISRGVDFKVPDSFLENCKKNLDMLLEFSKSDKMENTLWRDENE